MEEDLAVVIGRSERLRDWGNREDAKKGRVIGERSFFVFSFAFGL